jgi:PAS domain S-box-containing protein
MSIIINLIREQPFLVLPTDILGWLSLLLWLVVLITFLWRYREYQKPWNKKNTILFVVFLAAVPLTSLFIGLQLPDWGIRPIPEVALEPRGPAVLLFSALPWVLTAGLLGPFASALLAVGSGLLLALWDTHSPFTIVEMASLAVLLSLFSRQRYRQAFHAALRQPIIAAVLTSLLYPFIFLVNSLFFAGGALEGQIDYASTNVFTNTVAVGLPLWIAGLLAQFVKYALPSEWGGKPPWRPSPAERKLVIRSFRNILPVIAVLLVALIVVGWSIAGTASKQILVGRMGSAAGSAAEGIPYFLDSGQNLVVQIAASIPQGMASTQEMERVLGDQIQRIPYFTQLFVIDEQGKPVAGYPDRNFDSIAIVPDEMAGINLALKGVPNQVYVLPPLQEGTFVQLSFLSAILDVSGNVRGVLIGRTDFQTNPLARGITGSLSSLGDINGTGFLLDETNRIIYHPDPSRLLMNYPLEIVEGGGSFDDSAPDGTRQISYYQPAVGRPWTVVMTLPARESQQLALYVAIPLIGIVLLTSGATLFLVLSSLRTVTSSLKTLAIETDRIAKGDFDHPMHSEEVDEVGLLRRSFEQMRLSLKARLDELNQLLVVSQGIAASTDLEKALQPILESGLAMGASSSRILLSPAAIPEIGSESEVRSRFGLGESTHLYEGLDEQILILMSHQDRIVLPNPSRTTLLNFKSGIVRPGSLLAIALRHETQYYGAFWIVYNQEHTFSLEEVRFLTTLAGQAALAAFSNHLFWSAEYGRQRLAAILASTPDPVIVTDRGDHLLLANPLAQKVFGINLEKHDGQPVEDVIEQADLVNFIQSTTGQENTKEIVLPDGRIFLATVSSIKVEESRIGRVCVLRDITHFKELDALKSEFVATVSHDLRSPLTLLRGYATMLETVGELNKQQETYVRKIMTGVDSMARLINNLLDLGRIDADIGLRLQTLPIHEVFEDVIDSLRMKANQKRIQVHFEPEKLSSPLVEADHAMLHQAFQNLLDNAIKYSPDDKDVWIRVRSIDEKVVIAFEDQGIGVSAIDKPRLFEKFYRSAQRAARRESGTGLGLAIVKSVAERHGGRVWVESQLGKGSIFYFEIPLRQKKKVKEPELSQQEREGRRPGTNWGG